ncbi:MAG: diaminobutyrate--2-oxoglutarate transaminase [Chitinispirillales bacterium]|jgi:diaminobutyrate-2-oxoglutarate transaminase|nr:diaminobutyrate--2-oxoglutarate transaminase [Chitinispirillales bacterium]
MSAQIFEQCESAVRSYCRNFTDVFTKGKNDLLYGESGKEYVDFFAGAGALNYGHSNPFIKQKVIDYIVGDNISHALDMHTAAKAEFLEKFQGKILKPRNLEYKVMFTGPTGTNANEAAFKLARKVKKRTNIFAFMGAFHGQTLGALSATSDWAMRAGANIPLGGVVFMPFPYEFMASIDTIAYIESVLTDDHSGIEKPAAIVVEAVQGEGGLNVAPIEWLQNLEKLCRKHDILLILDEVQVGCGRTGTFFAFERAKISPDIVTLSKSIGGYGFPMALALIKPEYDIWNPGEHNGTFRGNQVAFVAAAAAIDFRESYDFDGETNKKAKILKEYVETNILSINKNLKHKGIGLIQGVDFTGISDVNQTTGKVVKECFDNGLILERAGRHDCIVKCMPPLTIEEKTLLRGLEILKNSIKKVLG